MVDYEKAAELLIEKCDKLRERIIELEKQLHDAIQCRQCSAKTELSDGLIGCRAKERIKDLEEDKENSRQYASGLENAQNLITVRYKELETELEKHRWIPVSERMPEEGNCLVLCEGKVYEVKVRVSEDEWEDNEGKSSMEETAYCDIRDLGSILIGHDECITHWKPIILP